MNVPSERLAQVMNRIADIETRLQDLGINVEATSASSDFSALLDTPAAPPATTTGVTPDMQEWIMQASGQYGIRPGLLRALIKVESGFNPRAVSSKGAMGLMQLMPSTADALGLADPFDPELNIMAGARYLRQQLDQFGGDERLALAAYNAGPGAVSHYHGVPPYAETQRYVTNVLSLAAQNTPDR